MVNAALHDIRVLDLSRVLAGPYCTQMLGDLGADIIKVEKPGAGDDTRHWGPPFLKGKDGQDTAESAYYLSANRNKKSIAIDIQTEDGQKLIHKLLEKSDVLIQNFKTGGLDRYGLGYEQIKARHPHVIYCAITGFGQTGPLAQEPGYDFLAQGMGGLMMASGTAGGPPTKTGIAISDLMTGLHAAIGILSALHARGHTGQGQLVDVSLLDCTVAAMTNVAQYYLSAEKCAPRVGNAHSTIVPYEAFEASNGHIIIAIGNDKQFKEFCAFIEKPGWAEDELYATNTQRVLNRETLIPMIKEIISQHPKEHWLKNLRGIDVPCGPVNSMDKVFDEPQIAAREMKIEMDHPLSAQPTPLVGSPLKLSETPVRYNNPPPFLGQHTQEILENLLQLPYPARPSALECRSRPARDR